MPLLLYWVIGGLMTSWSYLSFLLVLLLSRLSMRRLLTLVRNIRRFVYSSSRIKPVVVGSRAEYWWLHAVGLLLELQEHDLLHELLRGRHCLLIQLCPLLRRCQLLPRQLFVLHSPSDEADRVGFKARFFLLSASGKEYRCRCCGFLIWRGLLGVLLSLLCLLKVWVVWDGIGRSRCLLLRLVLSGLLPSVAALFGAPIQHNGACIDSRLTCQVFFLLEHGTVCCHGFAGEVGVLRCLIAWVHRILRWVETVFG